MHKKDIDCPHFQNCSGCSFDNNVNSPPLLEEAQAFFVSQNFSPLVVHSGRATHWRCRAKLAVRGTSKAPEIGLYRAHSHDVVPIPFCQIHHPKINEAIDILKHWMQKQDISPYSEKTGNGLIRYVQCVVERATNKVQLSLVLNSSASKGIGEDYLKKLWMEGKNLWHSIWLNFNTRKDNVIFGENWLHIYGESLLWERIAGVDICFQPANFAQANLDLFEKMIESIRNEIPENAKVCELFAGVGAIGLAIAKKKL